MTINIMSNQPPVNMLEHIFMNRDTYKWTKQPHEQTTYITVRAQPVIQPRYSTEHSPYNCNSIACDTTETQYTLSTEHSPCDCNSIACDTTEIQYTLSTEHSPYNCNSIACDTTETHYTLSTEHSPCDWRNHRRNQTSLDPSASHSTHRVQSDRDVVGSYLQQYILTQQYIPSNY